MSGKSKEEIAFDLVSKLKGVGVWGENNMSAILDMYAECLEATSGLRNVKGVSSANATPAQAAPPQEFVPQAAPQQAPQQALQQPAQHSAHQQQIQMTQSHNLVHQG
jgi:hypothetical protein